MKTVRSLMLIAFLVAGFSTVAAAQTCYSKGWRYAIFNGSYSPYGYNPCYGRADGGNFAFGATMWWNSSGRTGIQNYVSGGRRYTHDLTDTSNRLNGNGWYSTNFPSPYPDYDDDNGNGSREEWEVTVEDSSFPVAYRDYWVIFWATYHSSWGSGYVAHTPAISEQLWWTSDKWDTYRYSTTPYNQYYNYNYNFSDEEPETKFAGEADLLNRRDDKDRSEKQDERIIFSEPISIGDFQAQISREGKSVKSFLLEYEVDTDQGSQIVYVGGIPSENELVSLSTAYDVLNSAPVALRSVRLRGVVSYSMPKADEPESK